MILVHRSCLAGVLLFACASHACAEVKLPAIFGSHMVLQREMKVPVWGAADPGEQVTVSFAGQTKTTAAGKDGKWNVTLAPMPASGDGRTLTVAGTNKVQFDDVLVGEVWICSGQSNMVLSAVWTENGANEIKAANFPAVRMLTVPGVTALTPQPSFDGKLTPAQYDGFWQTCTPDVMKDFSAVGYFFGRDLHKRLHVPIGLIGAYWSGTPAQAWTSKVVLEGNAELKSYLTKWDEHTTQYPRLKKEWDARDAAARAQGKTLSVWFDPEPQHPVTSAGRPANLFNGMINPLIPFAMRGVIWYQGESNAGNPEDALLYRRLFPAMITDWRTRWGEGDFPFLFVQLCAINKRQQEPVEGGSNWAILRESQLKSLTLPNTGMAVIFDTDPTGNLHPVNKKPVGERLALAALKVAYGKDVETSGPIFDRMEMQGDKIVLHFKHAEGGLVSKTGDRLKCFAIAGPDRKYVWADAKIEGDAVVISSPEIKAPAAVRYAWANNAEASLFNKAGLPASPFRTDDWELQAGKPRR
jgi:sialate O-acetylesterase